MPCLKKGNGDRMRFTLRDLLNAGMMTVIMYVCVR